MCMCKRRRELVKSTVVGCVCEKEDIWYFEIGIKVNKTSTRFPFLLHH